jgi:hypothetical protein
MSEEALRELLRSPLDDPQPRRSRPLRLAGIGMLALAVGGGAAFGGSALLADEELPAPASTTVTTTTVPADTRVQAAEGVGLEASWIYDAGDDLYVGLSTVVDPGTDRTTADGIQTGWWRLRVADGREFDFTAEFAAPTAQGMLTVEFPGVGVHADDLEALVVLPMIDSVETTTTAAVDVEALPWPGPLDGPEADGVTIIVDEVRIDDAGGFLTWRIDGLGDRRAVVRLQGTYRNTETGDLERFVAETDLPAPPLQLSPASGRPARSGTIQLFRLDDPDNPSFRSRYTGDADAVVTIDGITFEWSVVVFRYRSATVAMPLSEAALHP